MEKAEEKESQIVEWQQFIYVTQTDTEKVINDSSNRVFHRPSVADRSRGSRQFVNVQSEASLLSNIFRHAVQD